MYYKQIEFIHPLTKSKRGDYTKNSHLLNYNRLYTISRMKENKLLSCTIQGCFNNRDAFGRYCQAHKYQRVKTGTFSNSNFKFSTDIAEPSTKLYHSDFNSDTLEALEKKIEELFSNPYTHYIEIVSDARTYTIAYSKEKISKYIKEHKPKRFDNRRLALRMSLVFKLFQEGKIEGGGQLRVVLAQALIPHTTYYFHPLRLKEVIGNIVLKNYIKDLSIIASELQIYKLDIEL